jgi:hypothetical protein
VLHFRNPETISSAPLYNFQEFFNFKSSSSLQHEVGYAFNKMELHPVMLEKNYYLVRLGLVNKSLQQMVIHVDPHVFLILRPQIFFLWRCVKNRVCLKTHENFRGALKMCSVLRKCNNTKVCHLTIKNYCDF